MIINPGTEMFDFGNLHAAIVVISLHPLPSDAPASLVIEVPVDHSSI